MGTVAALAADLDPVEREQVWNIGEDNTPEDTVEYTGILEEFWNVLCLKYGRNDNHQRRTV
jgi:hypothetical protein